MAENLTSIVVVNATDATVTRDPYQDIYDALKLFRSVAYLVLGALIFVSNLCVCLPIAYHHALRTRKEYIVLAALTFADAFNGLAYVLAGLYRMPMEIGQMYFGAQKNPFAWTSFNCALFPHNLLWGLFYTTTALLLCVVSFDRLLVTVFTMWYISQGPGVAYLLVGLTYAHGVLFEIVAFISGWVIADGPVSSDSCSQSKSMHKTIYSYQLLLYSRGHVASILIFVGALVAYALHNRKIAASGQVNAQAAKQQRDMTIKMAWSTLITLCLVIVPTELVEAIYTDYTYDLVALLYLPPLMNPLGNVYIFLVKHKLMRLGLRKMREGKKMPVNLKDWVATEVQPATTTKG